MEVSTVNHLNLSVFGMSGGSKALVVNVCVVDVVDMCDILQDM